VGWSYVVEFDYWCIADGIENAVVNHNVFSLLYADQKAYMKSINQRRVVS
jgi:hypothetical protein